MIRVIQSSQENQEKLKELEPLELKNQYNLRMDTVKIDSSKTFQTHLGFGGAFTEAAAYTFANTTKENQKEILEAYFNKEKGLAYNLGRTCIHCSDFSLEPYTYIEEGDETLDTFDMAREDKWVIPFLKEACAEADENLKILCSPWSPPAFMKDNKDINHGGKLIKRYYKIWAKYVVKYIITMKSQGFNMSWVSVQNEPEAKQIWASCKFSAKEESEFAVEYLYPELKKQGLEEEIKILIWDHNRDLIYRRIKESMEYRNARDIIWGIAYHWYVSDKSENLTMVHEEYPEKHLIFTEGCVELINHSGETSSDEPLGAWKHGEIYGRNIINDFNNFNEAWIDWNLLLDEQGGPNYVGNYCEAPILVDGNSGKIIYNISYYYVGHFSKYINPGAKRIQCMTDAGRRVYATAFQNADGKIIAVVQNELDEKYEFVLEVDGKGANVEVPKHSITTFIVE